MRRFYIFGIIAFEANSVQLYLYYDVWEVQSLPPVLQIICYPVNNWLWHNYMAIILATNKVEDIKKHKQGIVYPSAVFKV